MAVAARKIDTEYVYAGSPAMRVYTHRVPRAEEAPVVQQQEQAQEQPASKPAHSYSLIQKLLTTCAILAAAAAILLVMVRYADIAVQYAVVNEHKTTIEENNRTLAELEVRLNSAVSLEEAREAALAAGLGYPAASQIVSIDGTGAGSWSSSQ
ncbi:MAG: hypothetical protein IKK12_05420 [Clostridia bacterium]|nr:hypothetical protein [Clostridia bacterium]